MKKILVTGNLGYIGSVLTEVLQKNFDVVGYDIGFFEDCNLIDVAPLKNQIFKDIRDLSAFVSPMNSKVFKLIKRILPGPYALIMESAHKLPKPFQKRRSVGVRIPNHPILKNLLPLSNLLLRLVLKKLKMIKKSF